jgi:NAD(P)-dependent dehydrogenase (short-subunit alcohol dehydrogenase family)
MEIDGSMAVVTGGASGPGFATAEATGKVVRPDRVVRIAPR